MALPPNLKIGIDRLDAMFDATRELTTHRVLVGIPSDKAGRRDGPMNNATLGYIHEHGAPEANIPARPWLGPAVKEAQPALIKIMRQAAEAALRGRADLVMRQFNAAGLTAQVAAQKKLREGPFTPLSPVTLARRRARGVTRTNPLVDTAQMLQAVTYVIRKK
jgi:hypothetical protein